MHEFYEAWNEGMAMEKFGARYLSEDAEWHDQPELPDARVHRGREAIVSMLSELESTFGRARCEIAKIEPLGDEILSSFTLRGTGAFSGVDVAPLIAHLIRIRAGRINRIRAFFTLEGAFYRAHVEE